MAQAVLITGGAKRIGAALSLHFAQAGYDIALHYHRSQQAAEEVKAQIEGIGQRCELFCHDLTDIQGIAALMQQVQVTFPNCTALINNASVFERAELPDTDEALFDRQFTANLKAPFFLTQAFARTMGKGCVVNLLDTDITRTQGSHFAYLLSKKALADFTLMAARALGPEVRVNGVCPGIMLPSNELDEDYMKRLSHTLPLRQLGSIEQTCEAAHMLCAQNGLTGQIIYIDRGQHLL